MTTSIAVFDLETTGIDESSCHIVTAYVGLLDSSGTVVDDWRWLAAPDGYEIPESATDVHGVTTEYAKTNGRPEPEVASEIAQVLRELCTGEPLIPVAGQNLAYDLSVMAHTLVRAGWSGSAAVEWAEEFTVLDSLVLDKQLDRFRKGKRTLTALADVYGVAFENAHEADADAVAAGRIVLRQLQRPELSGRGLNTLHAQQKVWARAQASSFIAYRRRTDPTFTTRMSWPLGESALALAE